MNDIRRERCVRILYEYFPEKTFRYLGEGKFATVFTDECSVFKVVLFVEEITNQLHYSSLINSVKHKFEKSAFFYSIEQILEIDSNCFILIYPFEKSEACTAFAQDEVHTFLVECWQKRLIFKDIKPKNFIRVNGNLKWIDYEPDTFTDNLFLNMAARSFIYTKYPNESQSFLNKLCRSAINNFDLPELKGFQDFANTLFSKIIFQESEIELHRTENAVVVNDDTEILNSGVFELPYRDAFNVENVFWRLKRRNIWLDKVGIQNPRIDTQNYFSPESIILKTLEISKPKQNVSLVIKACVQDSEIVYEAVKHIVRQLSFPNYFDETILALDIRQSDFLREYNDKNTWEKLIEQSQKLVNDLVIDKFIYPSEIYIVDVNQKWFGLDCDTTHTFEKVPVSAQLYAFENAKNDLILQVDCDAMIGRLSKEQSFLNDMIDEIDKSEIVLSVGFNIYHGKETTFTPYFGFENGGFVPEVRFSLLKRSRIEKVLPLHNVQLEGGFKFSWYRALEQRQKETKTCSIRGGDSRAFYIHPHNFKKTDKDVWFTTVDRVEQLEIPEEQINEFDLVGSYYDWTISKRKEKLVIVSCFRNIPLSRFLRFWFSLISQTNQDWGLILIDDASDNGISHFVKELIKPYQNRITFIQNRFRVGIAQNTYKAIHYFMTDQESVVCVIDGDDALIGKNAIDEIQKKYSIHGADLVVGNMLRTDKIHPHYKYAPNFVNPRLWGGNVWQHIRSFKKYLFDSLGFEDLKIINKQQETDSILLSKRFSKRMVFPEHCWDFTYMVPIVEMAENPMWIDQFNILHDRTTKNTDQIKQRKQEIISEVLSKPSKTQKDVWIGRKTFLPNLNQIEIDITYECNLKCINCNRSSTQAPTKEGMTLTQIETFISESVEIGKKWKLINLLGGEPTMHKDFLEITNLILFEYISKHSPETILQVTSNGYGDRVKERLSRLTKHNNLIIDYASYKNERVVPYFSPFNKAPKDDPNGNDKDYQKGCWVTSYCGIGLNQLGYYPCGVAGGIDRVFNFNLGIKSLKDVDENIAKYLDTFCRYCGNFTDYAENFGNFIPRNEKSALIKPVISESWKQAYKTYNAKETSDITSKRRN